MKYFVVKGKYDTIYDGDIAKSISEGGGLEYKADIKQYHVYDFDRSLWETWPIDGNHKNIYLSKEMYKGRLREFPSFQIAQKACEKELK